MNTTKRSGKHIVVIAINEEELREELILREGFELSSASIEATVDEGGALLLTWIRRDEKSGEM